MERNQSTVDRIFRIAAGVSVLSLSLIGPRAIRGLFGIIPLVTGLTGFDPVYGILDFVRRRPVPVPAGMAKGGAR
jgi:hypothetical protein